MPTSLVHDYKQQNSSYTDILVLPQPLAAAQTSRQVVSWLQ